MPKTGVVNTTAELIRKVAEDSCDDVNRILRGLFPSAFEEKFAGFKRGDVVKVKNGYSPDGGMGIVCSVDKDAEESRNLVVEWFGGTTYSGKRKGSFSTMWCDVISRPCLDGDDDDE